MGRVDAIDVIDHAPDEAVALANDTDSASRRP